MRPRLDLEYLANLAVQQDRLDLAGLDLLEDQYRPLGLVGLGTPRNIQQA